MIKNYIYVPLIASGISLFLAIFKFILGYASSSMSVLSSGIDSLTDVLISTLNFFVLKKSKDPANKDFNYGYEKLESLMSFVEGLFIVCVGIGIFFGGVDKILHPEKQLDFNIAFFVMVFSLCVVSFLILFFRSVYKKTNSLVIKADLLNFQADFLTNSGIIVALIIIKITNWVFIDGLIAMLVSIYITFNAIRLVKHSAIILLDGAIEKDIINDIIENINSHKEIVDFHNFRTRKGVNTNFLEADLVFEVGISLSHAHKIADNIEKFIKDKYNNVSWIINFHFDPIDDKDEKASVINNVSF